MNIIPVNKLKSGTYPVNLAADGSHYINKAYAGSALTLVRFSEYPRLRLGEYELSFSTSQASETVSVRTNASWSASTSSAWITISTASTALTISVPQYTGDEDRTGTVVVTAYNADATISSSISVTQKVVEFVEYIQTDQKCWFDVGIIPDINTKIELDVTTMSRTGNWKGFIGAQNSDDHNSTFQIRTYNNQTYFSIRIGNGVNSNLGPTYTVGERYTLTLDSGGFDVNGTSYSVGTTTMDTCNYTLYLSAIHNPSWSNSSGSISDSTYYRAICAKFHRLKVWQNGVLSGDFRAALDPNGVPSFYDEVTKTYIYNLGVGTPIAGPSL